MLVITSFKKALNSFYIIPFLEDLVNRYLVYFVIKKKGKMRK